jgi:hypothetical protein
MAWVFIQEEGGELLDFLKYTAEFDAYRSFVYLKVA